MCTKIEKKNLKIYEKKNLNVKLTFIIWKIK